MSSTALASEAAPWQWPVQPVHVVRGFDPPDSDYGPGHRGIDLSGRVGQTVSAVADGTVVFAAELAGRGVVSVQHPSGLRSTYEPVRAIVRPGQRVLAGQPLGTLSLPGSHCLPDACLHLGARRGSTYLDPLSLLPAPVIRLKPLDGTPTDASTILPDTAPSPVTFPPMGRTTVATMRLIPV